MLQGAPRGGGTTNLNFIARPPTWESSGVTLPTVTGFCQDLSTSRQRLAERRRAITSYILIQEADFVRCRASCDGRERKEPGDLRGN